MKGKGKALARSWSSPGSNLLEEQHVPSVAATPGDHQKAAAALPTDGGSAKQPYDQHCMMSEILRGAKWNNQTCGEVMEI